MKARSSLPSSPNKGAPGLVALGAEGCVLVQALTEAEREYLYALHPDMPAAKTMLFKSVLIPCLNINSSKYLALEAIIVISKIETLTSCIFLT